MKPRDRIASHLRRILVAAGMALPSPGPADTSTPNPPPGKPGETKKPGNKEPEHLGYEVVDMLPEPFIQKNQTGTLTLDSVPPGAAILIDGKDIKKKTPLRNWKLPVGTHALTLKKGSVSSNLTVTIRKDQTTYESLKMPPSPAPEPKK